MGHYFLASSRPLKFKFLFHAACQRPQASSILKSDEVGKKPFWGFLFFFLLKGGAFKLPWIPTVFPNQPPTGVTVEIQPLILQKFQYNSLPMDMEPRVEFRIFLCASFFPHSPNFPPLLLILIHSFTNLFFFSFTNLFLCFSVSHILGWGQIHSSFYC